MARKKKSIADTIAEAVDKEIKRNENQLPEEIEERSLDDELDFDTINFGDLTEENYDD